MLGLVLGLSLALPQGGEQDPPVGLTVVMVDVGQGDGLVVRAPDGTIHCIDGGPNGQGAASMLPVINGLAPTGYGFTFLSHFHDDHHGGMDELLSARAFQFAYDRGDVRRTNQSPEMANYITSSGARRRTLVLGQTYSLGGGATVRVIAMNGQVVGGGGEDPTNSAQEENSRSVALRLEYRQFSMWLGGDLTGGGNSTSDIETDAALACGDVDVYKVNHHGSNTSTNTSLVTRLDPELAIVSCGTGNSYGHPTTTVVNRLNQAAAARALLSTTTGAANVIGFGALGNIRIDTDGRRYRATAENGDFLDFLDDEVTSTLAVGDVRISEVQRNPNRVPDTNGEYVEVVTTGPRPLALKGLRLADNGSTITLAANYMLVPGRPLVLQVDGVESRNGGLPLGVSLPFSTLALSDTTDTLTLSRSGVTLDSYAYSGAVPGGAGVAAERRSLLQPNSNANYAAATVVYGDGDLGSPGRRNDADSTASPGFPFLNAQIPLNFDPLLQTFLGTSGTVAPLPALGYRSVRHALPLANPLSGVPLYAAHIVIDFDTLTIPGVSAPVSFVLP
jgi:beta-lactamase superfamily II metal-dependent hydrolase